MTNPDPQERIGSIGDIVAGLTQIRAEVADWEWDGDCILGHTPVGTVQFRHVADAQFAPYRYGAAGFRRIPRIPEGSFREVTQALGL
jgi:hypothetical protein